MYVVYDTNHYFCMVVLEGRHNKQYIKGTLGKLSYQHLRYLTQTFLHSYTPNQMYERGFDLDDSYTRVVGYTDEGKPIKERVYARLYVWVEGQDARYVTHTQALEICSRLPYREVKYKNKPQRVKQAYQYRNVGVNQNQYKLADRVRDQYKEAQAYALVKKPKIKHTKVKESKKTAATDWDIDSHTKSKSWKDQSKKRRQYY